MVVGTTVAVQFGGLNISSDGIDGVNWLLSLDGWEDTPPVRVDDVPRLNSHGSFQTPVWAGPRVVVATGFSLSDTARDTVFQATQNPMRVPGATAATTLAVTAVGRSLSANAQFSRYSPVMLNRGFWQNGHFPWVIEWRCADPFRYGPTTTVGPLIQAALTGGLVFPLFSVSGVMTWGTIATPQTATLTNPGTADAQVTFTVAAGATDLTGGFQIVEQTTGSTIRYIDDLPANSSVVFNTATGSVTLNGTADRRGSVTVAQWAPIPPGTSRTYILALLSGTSTTASLTASTRPTYW
jgi:hypothetical protein